MKPAQALAVEQDLEFQDMLYRARNGLLNFTRFTMPEYEVNWHHRTTSKFLNAWLNKKFRFGMIFQPPRHGKSELTSRRLPAFIHGRFPKAKILAGSYNSSLAGDMCRDVQRIMDTPEYRLLFPGSPITPDGERTQFRRTGHEHELAELGLGSYKCAGVNGSFTGKGGDYIIVDDPFKGRKEADSPAYRKAVWDWWVSTLRKRMEKNASVLIIMTRWHEDDLAGKLLEAQLTDPNAIKWEILSLPAIKEKPHSNPSDVQKLIEESSRKYDTRKVGEPLWPEKYSLEELASIRADDEREWLSLYQQTPTAREGGIIKREWFKYYTTLPDRFDEIIQSWDCTFKETKGTDYVVGQVWGRKGADCYLLYEVRERMDFPKTVEAIRMVSSLYPKALCKLVEDKANGPAVISTLQRELPGLIAVEPNGTKEARLSAVAPGFKSGNVFVPDPKIAPWVKPYIEEIVNFPTAKHDDRVDATSQALLRLIVNGGTTFSKKHIPNSIQSFASKLREING